MNKLSTDLTIPELLNLFWNKKLSIFIVTSIFSLAGITISLIITPVYTSNALLSPSTLSSNISNSKSGLGSSALSSLVGLSSSSSTELTQASSIITSREFTKKIISAHNILPELFAAKHFDKALQETTYDASIFNKDTGQWLQEKLQPQPSFLKANEVLNKIVSFKIDSDLNLATISVTHVSPIFARDLIEILIFELNQIARIKSIERATSNIEFLKEEMIKTSEIDIRQSISSLIESQLTKKMLASVKDEYLLEYIDPPFIPYMKSAPKRTIIVILFTMIGFLIAMSSIWLKFYYANIESKS